MVVIAVPQVLSKKPRRQTDQKPRYEARQWLCQRVVPEGCEYGENRDLPLHQELQEFLEAPKRNRLMLSLMVPISSALEKGSIWSRGKIDGRAKKV